MRHSSFVGENIDPSDVYANVQALLQSRNFKIEDREVSESYWHLKARKSNMERMVTGSVREVELFVRGKRHDFEVQLHAGMWGRDLVVPAVEGFATLGTATIIELESAHQFEERLWEEIVHGIDESLRICKIDGLVFKSTEDLKRHVTAHELEQVGQSHTMDEILWAALPRGYIIEWGQGGEENPRV
jgi:hypothetical protein